MEKTTPEPQSGAYNDIKPEVETLADVKVKQEAVDKSLELSELTSENILPLILLWLWHKEP